MGHDPKVTRLYSLRKPAPNMLPLGQQLWLDWFETLREFPPMQKPESYNLTSVMDQIRASGHPGE